LKIHRKKQIKLACKPSKKNSSFYPKLKELEKQNSILRSQRTRLISKVAESKENEEIILDVLNTPWQELAFNPSALKAMREKFAIHIDSIEEYIKMRFQLTKAAVEVQLDGIHKSRSCSQDWENKVALPIVIEGKTIGKVFLSEKEIHLNKKRLLMAYTYSLASQLKLIKQNDQEMQITKELSALNLIGNLIFEKHESEDILYAAFLDSIIKGISNESVFPFDRALVTRVDEQNQMLIGVAARGIKNFGPKFFRVPLYKNAEEARNDPKPRFLPYLVATGENIYLDNAPASKFQFPGFKIFSHSEQPVEICGVPIRYGEKCFGAIVVDNFTYKRHITENEVKVLKSLTNQIAITLANIQATKKLEGMAIKHGITDLFSHTYFQGILPIEVEEAMHSGKDLSLLFMDIDFFKRINDKHGHAFGDKVLKGAADLIKKNIRTKDIPACHGGDEFVVLLKGMDLEQAFDKSIEIKKAIDTHDFEGKRITTSIGVASLSMAPPGDAKMRANMLVEMADNALNKAKETGRGKICRAESHAISHRESRISKGEIKVHDKESLNELLHSAIEDSLRYGYDPPSLLFLHLPALDGNVNELKKIIRRNDKLVNCKGGNYAIIMPETGKENAWVGAKRIANAMGRYGPIIGLSLYNNENIDKTPTDKAAVNTCERMVESALAALEKAKTEGTQIAE